MAANVTRIPVAMKRGRKVSTGPKASVTVLYELAQKPQRASLPQPREQRLNRMAELAAKSILRRKAEQAAYEAWIDASPTVARFPELSRYRSLEQVHRLQSGTDDDADESTGLAGLDEEIAEVCRRRDAILAEANATGGEIG